VTLRVRCPRCDCEVVADESKPLPPGFPFCSERCSYSDLGKWFDEEYRVSRALRPGEIDVPREE
jgi:endogenous inhibitor of DNA gyrase (YacG/DUF329 family)